MDFHIVSGFLGSGKTTAIIAASKILMAQNKKVGVVTNDQGKYLVDTAFFKLAAVPTVEVTGGCFCCNYDDLDARLTQLKHTAQPDVIFAESVGSCADIVATVVKPLIELHSETFAPTSFSVFTDARMLRRRLFHLPMPFSDDVVYIFDKQIEEAGILVINKRDLFSDEDAEELIDLAMTAYPDKVIRLQNSLDHDSVNGWLNLLTSSLNVLPLASLEIDYHRYGKGESQLAWLDETVTLHAPEGMGRAVILMFLTNILNQISHHKLPVGHLKFLVKGQNEDVKISFVSMDEVDWEDNIPKITGTRHTILVNARIEGTPDKLRDIVHNAVLITQESGMARLEESMVTTFHPGYPSPTHRIDD
jgi:Ni2+-binding GTPase involved in maturation of urease and hydrogenase